MNLPETKLMDKDVAYYTTKTESTIGGVGITIKTLKRGCFSNVSQGDIDRNIDLITKAQDAKTKRVIAEWLMNYIDINLEEIIPDDKYTLFFIPNDKLKAIKKWALGE